MQSHIARTIEDIELKIGFLQRMVDALRTFGNAADVGAPIPVDRAEVPAVALSPEPRRRGRKPRLEKNPATPPQSAPVGARINQAHKVSAKERMTSYAPLSPAMLKAGKTVSEPFDADTLGKHVGGVSYQTAANALTRWAAKKWITRVSPGRYQRTAEFGQDHVPSDLEALHRQIRGEVEAAKSEED